jgi:hypothetical protein
VTTYTDLLVAAGHSADPGRWPGIFDELMTRIGSRFRRVEPRHRARAFVLGLLAELPRKNCWTIAEHATARPKPIAFTGSIRTDADIHGIRRDPGRKAPTGKKTRAKGPGPKYQIQRTGGNAMPP